MEKDLCKRLVRLKRGLAKLHNQGSSQIQVRMTISSKLELGLASNNGWSQLQIRLGAALNQGWIGK